jgi:hypothetical protein
MRYFPAEMFVMPALVALVAAALAGRALRRGGRPLAPGRAPCCGACGYDTRGLTKLTCPECGNDLRIVGIGVGVTRRMPRLVHFAACAIFLSFLMFAWQSTLTNLVAPLVPAALRYSNDIRVTSRADPNRAFTIASAGPGRGSQPPVTIDMHLRVGGGGGWGTQPATLVYDPARDADFGPKTVLAWMTAAGLTVDPAATKEAARVAGLARKVARYTRGRAHADWAYGGSGGSRSNSGGTAGIFASFTENYATRPSSLSLAASQGLRVLWAMLWIALLIVLFRAIVAPRVPSATFTPPPARE